MGTLGRVVVEDCHGVLRLYDDGSVFRASQFDIDFGNINNIDEDECSIEWEDCIFDEEHQLHLRVYKPAIATNTREKLPIVYYLHGGGFCLGSRTWPNCHNCCLQLCSKLQAVVIAPDYRLAPEHRLPAAIEDGFSSLKWLQSQARSTKENNIACRLLSSDDCDGVDFDKVFIVGDSSGGNIAHHLAVRLGPGSLELAPVRIRGYVLLAPFFGGSHRTISEADGPPEPILNLETLDRFWRLSLPHGESRDHPFANPFGPKSPNLKNVVLDPMLVIVGSNEIMKDRIKDYATRLKNLGKDATYLEVEGEYHGFLTHNPCSSVSKQVIQVMKQFMVAT